MQSPLHKRKAPPVEDFGDGSGPNLNVCAAEEIKSVIDYRFNSNKHTHMFLFVTQAFLIFIVRIWIFCCATWVYLKSLNGNP